MKKPRVKRRKSTTGKRRGFYVIPSLFTVANIFCGFLSIVASSRGQFERASILILIAIFADVLDGRIARLTGTVTQFGEEFDSLADVTSFGVAPALLAFQWGLWEVPRVGMAVAFLFLVAGSIRLARFSATDNDSLDFIGLPIPAGAGSIAMLVLTSPSPVTHPAFIPVVVAFVLGLSLLMVSNLPYPSFKGVNLRRKWPAPTLFLIALAFSLITLTPHFLSILAAIYIISAPVTVLTRKVRHKPDAAREPVSTPGDTNGALENSDS
ncbi:MAG: CDP-diacylglycerol--serine O-phosphatidyltransferase [Acidobacteriota bacterium]|nr:CDP-diacylglycerol--serine O-phosphatidyltransferase [Acidobacteriota bacterium]